MTAPFPQTTKQKGTEAQARRKGAAEEKEETEEVEGERGDMPGYVPTPEDLRLWEVYRDWVHGNPGTHLDGGVKEDRLWQGWWRDLAVMPIPIRSAEREGWEALRERLGGRTVGDL